MSAPTFRAVWPILDRALSRDELIAEAIVDLPNVRPARTRLRSLSWEVTDTHLVMTARADAMPTPPGHRQLPAHPLLQHFRHRGWRGLSESDQRVLERAQITGYITERAADRIACKLLGLHPALIWGDEWFEDVA